jgi:hypothetical protein
MSSVLDHGSLVVFQGIDRRALRAILQSGVDHGGNPIEPVVDEEGDWPLRCCLHDSAPDERIAIIAWSPFPWRGAYAETGPIVVHADGCPTLGADDASTTATRAALPEEFDIRPMTLRPYTADHRIDYARVRHVPAGRSLTIEVTELLSHDDVAEVYGRNATGGCFAFRAVRTEAAGDAWGAGA